MTATGTVERDRPAVALYCLRINIAIPLCLSARSVVKIKRILNVERGLMNDEVNCGCEKQPFRASQNFMILHSAVRNLEPFLFNKVFSVVKKTDKNRRVHFEKNSFYIR